MTAAATPDPEQAFEEFPFDFNGYLARRLGIPRETAMNDLGHWLAQYEPAESQSGSRPGVRRCRSGVFPTPGNPEASPLVRSGAA
jgi:hypothetical protein